MKLNYFISTVLVFSATTQSIWPFGVKQPKLNKDLSSANSDLKQQFETELNRWDGSDKKASGKDTTAKDKARVKYYNTKTISNKKYQPIYAKKGKKFYGGIYVQQDCPSDKKIEGKLNKEKLLESVKEQQLFTIECGGKVNKGFVN